MGQRRLTSEQMLNKILTTTDLIYDNFNKRYPKDTQTAVVRMMCAELSSFERLVLNVWPVLLHTDRIKTLMVIEEYNFALLRKNWKSESMSVYKQRVKPHVDSLTEISYSHLSILQKRMADIYSSIDNTFLPSYEKEPYLNGPPQNPV